MRVWVVLSVVVALVLPVSAWPQSREETLADIRQELTVMYVEIQKLRRELSTTGGVSTGGSGGTVLDRVNAIEAELQSVTARTGLLPPSRTSGRSPPPTRTLKKCSRRSSPASCTS